MTISPTTTLWKLGLVLLEVRGNIKGEVQILWQESGLEIWFWRSGVHPVATQYKKVQHYVQ